MNIRPYETKEYEKLKSWWERRDFPPANPRFMAPTGVIISDETGDICAGFLFKSDANVAIIGNIVSNPDREGKVRSEALDLVINHLSLLAKTDGFEMICCSTNLDRLMERFEKHGFIKTDKNVSNFGRII